MNESPVYILHKLIFTLDRVADRVLSEKFGISHKRALFLVVLQRHGSMTQHELAVALGYTDPAVSSMMTELIKKNYVTVMVSPDHGRKRIVELTAKGEDIVIRARQTMDRSFEGLLAAANVDGRHYGEITEKIYQTLIRKEAMR